MGISEMEKMSGESQLGGVNFRINFSHPRLYFIFLFIQQPYFAFASFSNIFQKLHAKICTVLVIRAIKGFKSF